MSHLANGLKQLRIERGLTQSALAKELHVTQNAVFNWENEKREPNLDTIRKIANYFNTSLVYLLDGKEEFKTPPKFIAYDENGNKIEIKNNKPPKFTDRSTSFEESKAQEEAHNLIDSIPNEMSLSWEREKIALQLRDILSTYSELNNAGREAAVKRIEELRYSDVMTDSRLDDIYFNRVKKKINKGEKLSSDEIEWWHNYLDKSVKTVGAIFESLFSMLNEEGRRKAHTQINRAIDQIEMLTKIPEYQKDSVPPPQE